MENQYFIGVDVGGTTFTSTCFDHKGQVVENSSIALVSSATSQKELLDNIAKQIQSIAMGKNITGVGLACPGPLLAEEGKILDTPNLTLLQQCEIVRELESRTGLFCKIENDANMFALGEYGVYNGDKSVFVGVTLGTGLGFGVLINGKLFTGAHGMAAEYGISPINDDKWESIISIGGIELLSNEFFGEVLTPIKLNEMATLGEKNAILLWQHLGEHLGECLSHVINLLNPHAISIGGGLSHAFLHFEASMKHTISQYSLVVNQFPIHIFESSDKALSAKRGAIALF